MTPEEINKILSLAILPQPHIIFKIGDLFMLSIKNYAKRFAWNHGIKSK